MPREEFDALVARTAEIEHKYEAYAQNDLPPRTAVGVDELRQPARLWRGFFPHDRRRLHPADSRRSASCPEPDPHRLWANETSTVTAARWARLREPWARAATIGMAAAQRFGQHRMPTHAAALAYRGALALFPFLLLVVGLAHAVGLDAITTALAARAVAEQPEERGALTRWLTAQIEEPPGGGLLSVGVITALWAVAAGIRNLRQALAIAADAPDVTERPMWRRILLSMSLSPLVVAAMIAAAVSLLVTSRAIETVAGWLGSDGALAQLFTWLRVPVALTLVTLLIAAGYWFAPIKHASFRSVIPGAVLAALSWTLMSLGFSVALATVLDYGATYGSFGAAIGLLVYLQLSAAVVLAGAEVNAILAGRGTPAEPPGNATAVPTTR